MATNTYTPGSTSDDERGGAGPGGTGTGSSPLGSQTGGSRAASGSMATTATTSAGAGDSRLVTGLFHDRESAENAYRSVSSRGYGKDDVNLVMSDETRARHFAGDDRGGQTELGTKAAEGAGIGGAIGGGLGAVIAAVAAIGTNLVLPGAGLVIAGPLAAAVAGAGAGGAAGGIIGALIGWGIPEERVAHYEEGIKKGGILMAVRPKSDEDAAYFENDWRANRGEHVYR